MIRPEEITVLIPAAGRVPAEPLRSGGAGCPAMIPVGGRPVAYWTLKYLRELGLTRFVVAVAERDMYVEKYLPYVVDSGCEIRFLRPTVDGGLGRTVMELADTVGTKAALVVLGDTSFQFVDPEILRRDEPAVLTAPVEESYRWCTAEVDADGFLTALHDKEPAVVDPLQALIGVYFFPAVDGLRKAAHAAVAEADSGPAAERNGKTEMAAVLRNVGLQKSIRAYPAAAWQDCGNPDLQLGSHRKLLESRAFNQLQVDPLRGLIQKRSQRREKLIDEINYLRLLPPELGVLFPRLVDFSIAPDDPWMRMEYFGFPTLAEVFLYERLSSAAWSRIFGRLDGIVRDCFMSWPRTLEAGSLRAMYLDKPADRLASLTGPPELLRWVASEEPPITVNGRRLDSLKTLLPRIERRIADLARNAAGSIIHGDLCLSNILYDWRSDVCKLIDPRGSFGSSGIYGDPRYDVAKLYHSLGGGYDFIVHDLFQIETSGDEVRLDLAVGPHHDEARVRFEQVFFKHFDRTEILLITALLFISMPPLHYDHPRRQLAMFVRGLQLLDELFSIGDG